MATGQLVEIDQPRRKPALDAQGHRLINDVAVYRDLKSDLKDFLHYSGDEPCVGELDVLEEEAIALLTRDIETNRGLTRVKLAVIGDFSAGKSSFINSLLGKPICPVNVNPTTSSITRFVYSDRIRIVCRQDGEREISQAEYEVMVQHGAGKETGKSKGNGIGQPPAEFAYYYPFEGFRDIELYDTPGFHNPENPGDEQMTREIAKDADVIFFILDVNKPEIGEDTLEIINGVCAEHGYTEWYAVLNRADQKPNADNRKKIYESFKCRHKGLFKELYLYSATDVLATQNGDVYAELAGSIRNRVEAVIDNGCEHEAFNLSLEKRGKFAKSYRLLFGEESLDIHRDGSEFAQVRMDFLVLLSEIAERKDGFIREELDHEFHEYDQDRRTRLIGLSEELERGAVNGDQVVLAEHLGRAIDEFADKIRKLHSRHYQTLDEGMREIAKLAFTVKDMSKIEKPYLNTPFARVTFHRSKLDKRKISDLPYFTSMRRGLTQAAENFATDYGMSEMKADLQQDIEEMERLVNEKVIAFAKTLHKDVLTPERKENGTPFWSRSTATSKLSSTFAGLDENRAWETILCTPASAYVDNWVKRLKEFEGKARAHGDTDRQNVDTAVKKIEDVLQEWRAQQNEGGER